MPEKLKTYQTSIGFFELAIAAPSMKAALKAWGSKSNPSRLRHGNSGPRNHRRIAGERVSTAHVESTVNELVIWRMCKKQQMRWSPMSAQLLLHVHTADLNGRLPNYIGLKPAMRIAANDDRHIATAS